MDGIGSGFYTLPSEEVLERNQQAHHKKKTVHISGSGDGSYQSIHADGYKTSTLEVSNELCLYNSEVVESLKASDMVCFDCPFLGNLEASSSIALINCNQIGNIVKAPELLLKNSRVLGDVNAGIVTLQHSTVEGTLTATCQEVKVRDSQVNKLSVNKPVSRFAIISANGEEIAGIPPDLAPLVQAVQSGKMSIKKKDKDFHVHLGKKNTGFVCTLGSINKRIHITSDGASYKDGMIHAGGVTLKQETLSTVKNLREVLRIVAQTKQNIPFTKSETNVEAKPQVVIVNGGHVKEICFEIPGGKVICENGGTVGNIIHGTVASAAEKIVLKEAEPPENFLDPIFFTVMQEPHRTPLNHADHVYDYKTLKRLTDEHGEFKDPQTRIVYKLSDCKADLNLKAEIQEWLKTHKPI
jgi:U-box domain-containing protein